MEAIEHLPLLLRRAFEGWEEEEVEEMRGAGQRAKYLMADASISTTPPPSTPMDPAEREREREEEEEKRRGREVELGRSVSVV